MIAVFVLVAALAAPPTPPQTRCDNITETCRTTHTTPWHQADFASLCHLNTSCRHIERRPVNIGGYRTGDPVGNRGTVTDTFLWEVATTFPPEEWRHAIHVAACESGFNPNARNPRSTASGIYQHLESTWRNETSYWNTRGYMFDPNIAARFDLGESVRLTGLMVERDRGWSQWSCRRWTP